MTETRASAYRPMIVSRPGETLAELLEERGITQVELAERLDRPVKTVNEIVKGKAMITPETALQLERVLGTPAEFWLVRESRYRESKARIEDMARLNGSSGWLKELPLRDMAAFGWITRLPDPGSMVAECLRFFGVANVEAWRERYESPLVAFRASKKVVSHVGSIAAWLRQGEREADRLSCAPFDKHRFKSELSAVRGLTLEPDPEKFFPALQQRCAQGGVAVVVVRTPSGCAVSGATRWLGDKALLQLSIRHKTNDHLWFTFFHEAGHLLLHRKRLFIERQERIDDDAESEADRFATDTLIPRQHGERLSRVTLSRESVRRFSDEIGIAPGIVVGRMQKQGLLPWSHLNDLKVRYAWSGQAGTSTDDEDC